MGARFSQSELRKAVDVASLAGTVAEARRQIDRHLGAEAAA